MKKSEFKSVKTRAKEIMEKSKIDVVDQFNRRIRKGLSDEEVINAMRVLSHFISIPTHILNEEETAMFDEKLFEKINVTKK